MGRIMARRKRQPGRKQRQFRQRLRVYRESHRGRLRKANARAAVPSFFTLMNLFSGFVALTQIVQGNFEFACWFIFLAAIFDVLDGMMARLTKTSSLFGVELDSLSDIVSFGAAPSLLVYEFGLNSYGVFGLIISALPVLCGAIRLARFNTSFDGEKKGYFEGLPIPMPAMAIVALILNINDAAWYNTYSLNNLSVLVPIVVVFSVLMVSTIRFDAAPVPSAHYIRNHPYKFSAYFVGFLSIVFLQQIGLFISLFVYILLGMGFAAYRLIRTVLDVPLESESSSG